MRSKTISTIIFITAVVFLCLGITRESNSESSGDAGWERVSLGKDFTCGIKKDGTIYCWGKNDSGQLGIGKARKYHVSIPTKPTKPTEPTEPTKVGTSQYKRQVAASAKEKAKPPDMGAARKRQGRRYYQKNKWFSVGTGYNHTCAIKSNGTLWCWGDNEMGQLGIGKFGNEGLYNSLQMKVGNDNDWSSITSGDFYSCATKKDGSVWCWGMNTSGQLGIGEGIWAADVPTKVDINEISIAFVVAGYDSTCAVSKMIYTSPFTDIWCWGNNQYGQLGIGSKNNSKMTPTVPVGSPPAIKDYWKNVVVGLSHTCGIRIDPPTAHTQLYCWGKNNLGQLGNGKASSILSDTPLASGNDYLDFDLITAGANHTCGIKEDGTLWCWGDNSSGQLGIGKIGNLNIVNGVKMQVGQGDNWVSVNAGYNHTCAIKNGGSLWCWGNTDYGQLGYNEEDQILVISQPMSGLPMNSIPIKVK